MILVGVIGLWPEHGAEFMTGFIVHMLHELGLKVRVGSEATGGGDGGATAFAFAAVKVRAFRQMLSGASPRPWTSAGGAVASTAVNASIIVYWCIAPAGTIRP
jgi:hypothetical protein